MKQCSYCKEIKSTSEFSKKSGRRDGLQNLCKVCSSLKFSEYYNNNKEYHSKQVRKQKRIQTQILRAYLKDYLQSHPCVDCSESDWVVLEFDHVRGNKKTEISKLVSSTYALDTLKAEIDKCDVRCANCHRRKTSRQNKSYRIASIG